MTTPPISHALVWLRRDLRCHDHAALHSALTQARQVSVAFVFDRDILDSLPRRDRRVAFIRESLVEVDEELRRLAGQPGCGLVVRHGPACDEIVALARELGVRAVFASHDDEPQALRRDSEVRTRLSQLGIEFHTLKDHVVLERQEVLTQAGRPFSVFTPYRNAWMKRLTGGDMAEHPVAPHAARLAVRPPGMQRPVPSLADIGFEEPPADERRVAPGFSGARALLDDFVRRIDRYADQRDFPAIKGPSYLSVHLRFGTVSVRELVRLAQPRMTQGSEGARTWLNELVWRDFYAQIMANFPHAMERSFRPEYDAIAWEAGDAAQRTFDQWCAGRTGYPLVDAAMRQLNQTGYMHNRLRMVVASFLTKDLGLDWRWGERYFARQLLDFDLASNNGGWQWASSSGCDAQPYFRIFNPVSQSEKFDPQGRFIRRYCPELASLPDGALHAPWTARPVDLLSAGVTLGEGATYPLPVVDHAEARDRTLARYAVVKKSAQ